MAGQPADGHHSYAKFVTTTMQHVAAGLRTENHQTDTAGLIDKIRVADTMEAGQKTLLMRYMLGQEDHSYLQAGLSMLWSSPDEEDTLAPSALYKPDGTSGIEVGLLNAMKHHRAQTKQDAPALLKEFLKMIQELFKDNDSKNAFDVFFDASGVRTDANTFLGWVDAVLAWVNTPDPKTFPVKQFHDVRETLRDFEKLVKEGIDGSVVRVLELFNVDKTLARQDMRHRQEMLMRELAEVFRLESEKRAAQQRLEAAVQELETKLNETKAEELERVERKAVEDREAELKAKDEEYKIAYALLREEINDLEEHVLVLQTALAGFEAEASALEQRVLALSVKEQQLATKLEGQQLQSEDARRELLREKETIEGQLEQAKQDLAQTRLAKEEAERQLQDANLTIRKFENVRKERPKLKPRGVERPQGLQEAFARTSGRDNNLEAERQRDEEKQAAQGSSRQGDGDGDDGSSNDDPKQQPGVLGPLAGKAAELLRLFRGNDINSSAAHQWLARHAVDVAVTRGLVGQRGPLCADSKVETTCDDRLPYHCIFNDKCATSLAVLTKAKELDKDQQRRIHGRGVHSASTSHAALEHPSMGTDTSSTTTFAMAKALSAIGDNLAVIGKVDAHDGDERGGVERSYAVRWMPKGRAATTMASAAVLEHVHSTCQKTLKRIQEEEGGDRDTELVLAQVAICTKLMQTPMLLSLNRLASHLDPDVVDTVAQPLVTRPCAVMQGVVLYPRDGAGVALAPDLPISDTAEQHYAVNAHLSPLLIDSRQKTLEMHRAQRRAGVSPSTYVDIPTSAMPFVPRPFSSIPSIGAPGAGPSLPALHTPHDVNVAALMRILKNQGIQGNTEVDIHVFLDHLENAVSKMTILLNTHDSYSVDAHCAPTDDPVEAFLNEQLNKHARLKDTSTVVERRNGLHQEFLRNVMVSSDRLWVFVRTLSGFIGEDITAILTMADESAVKANKALQEQRTAIAKRVSDMQSKIVETVVTGMMKDSKLSLDKGPDGEMVIINSETRARLDELSRGDSGRPFFEANVAFQHLVRRAEREDEKRTTLTGLLTGLAETGRTMIQNMEATLNHEFLGGGPSLLEISHPTNSLFVHIKTDAVAAMRNTVERLNVELALRNSRRLSLWELCEGGNTTLTNRFCDIVGHVLVQARSSTGVSAMYTSQQSIMTNAMQANVALIKLVDYAAVYGRRVPSPNLPPTSSDASAINTMRQDYMDRACRVNEQAVAGTIERKRGYGGDFGSNKNLRAIMLETTGTPLYAHVSATRFGRYP